MKVREEDKPVMLQLLERFGLLFVKSDDPESLIVPSFFPEQVDDVAFRSVWPFRPPGIIEFGRNVAMGLLLKGFFSRVLYRCMHLAGAQTSLSLAWREGVVVQLEGATCLLRRFNNNLEVVLRFMQAF